jgi:hypothetical protein
VAVAVQINKRNFPQMVLPVVAGVVDILMLAVTAA